MTKDTKQFTWTCPKCHYTNVWAWYIGDIPLVGEATIMSCPNCKRDSKMVCALVEVK